MVRTMTERERILASLRGEPVDRLAWAPRWELWYNAAQRDGRIPPQYRGMSLYDMTRALGMGIKARGIGAFVREYDDVAVTETTEGNLLRTTYRMPEGTLESVLETTPELEAAGVRGRHIKNLIATEADFALAVRLVERTRIAPNHAAVQALLESVGEDGAVIMDGGFCPLHRAMRDFLGYQETYYALHDYPQQMARLLAALQEEAEAQLLIAARSPAVIIECDGNYDVQLTPPPLYRHYFLPWFQHAADVLHAAGKIFMTHTDGHNDGLMELIADSGFDVAEAFTPPPMTNISVTEARRIWGHRVAIWGGIASTMFSPPFTRQEFEAHVREVVRQAAPGDRFVLGTGDNVPTDGDLARVMWVTQMVREESAALLGR